MKMVCAKMLCLVFASCLLLVQGEAEKKVLKITVIEVSPYVEVNRTGSTNDSASEVFTGFVPDLLAQLSEMANFDYSLHLAEDGEYGSEEGGKWNGMIGEVLEGKADMTAGPLTITNERDRVVDFSYAFKNVRTVAVFNNAPRNEEVQLESVEDLLTNEFQFGVLKDSTIAEAISVSTHATAKLVWKSINADDMEGFQDKNNDGVEKARWDKDYAYLLDGATAEFILRREPCDLNKVSTDFYSRKYGFAWPNMWPLRDEINKAIVELQYDGTIKELEAKWWGEDQCSGSDIIRMSAIFIMTTMVAIFWTTSLL